MISTADRLQAQGYAKGYLEVRTYTLLNYLTLKFGPLPNWVDERVRAASMAQIIAWERVEPNADDLDSVFFLASGEEWPSPADLLPRTDRGTDTTATVHIAGRE